MQEVTTTTADVSDDGSSSFFVADVVISALVCGVCLVAAGAFYLRRQRQTPAPMTPVTAPGTTLVTASWDTLSVEMAVAAMAAAPSTAATAVAAAVTAATSVSPLASIIGSVDSRDVDNKGNSG